MYLEYKVVCVTPGGRRRYMEILLPYLLKQKGLIDEWRIWVNTTDVQDIRWMREAADRHPGFVKLVWGSMAVDANDIPSTIHQFFQGCTDEKTIYIRFDDDIVYVHHEAVSELCRYRLSHREPFLVFANTVNNSICTHIHQRLGAVRLDQGVVGYDCTDKVGWGSGEFAVLAHGSFLDALQRNDLNRYLFSQWIMWEATRFSINCFAWLGEDFARFGGMVGVGEEEWLTVTYPRERGLTTAICGSALVVHYAYYPQRPHLDTTSLVGVYKKLSLELNKEQEKPTPYTYTSVLHV